MIHNTKLTHKTHIIGFGNSGKNPAGSKHQKHYENVSGRQISWQMVRGLVLGSLQRPMMRLVSRRCALRVDTC